MVRFIFPKSNIFNTHTTTSFKGESTQKPTKKIMMKVEVPAIDSKGTTEEMSKLSISKAGGSKKTSGAKPKESHVSHEIKVFNDLKKGTFR